MFTDDVLHQEGEGLVERMVRYQIGKKFPLSPPSREEGGGGEIVALLG